MILNPLGLKAEVDIQPRHVGPHSTATQTVRVQVDKTCESIAARCRASSADGWVTFDSEPQWDRVFDPQDGPRPHWRRRSLLTIECVVARASKKLVSGGSSETVTVQLEARDRSNRSVIGEPDAIIDLMVK